MRYLIFWTQIYNFLPVGVIYTNYASDVMLIFYILGLSSIFIFIFFPIATLWNSWKYNVIQQIKKSWSKFQKKNTLTSWYVNTYIYLQKGQISLSPLFFQSLL